ncbi:MAG: ExbD/TolR family protein [Verrucomicrobiales bacterium]
MARRKKGKPAEQDEPGLDISSLIDVCFLLLIYFLVTTTITKKEQDTTMQLPSMAPSDTPPEIRPLFIRVEANGFIYIRADGAPEELIEQDSDTRILQNLKPRLDLYSSAAQASNSDPVVQVYVDGEAKQQRVIDVLNALAGAGISKVTFTDLIDAQN